MRRLFLLRSRMIMSAGFKLRKFARYQINLLLERLKGKDMTIEEIENLTYDKAKEIAVEIMKIKGHECIFAELGKHFGYSVLVFKNGHHVYFANDYELHHDYMVEEHGKEGLKEFYIKEMKNMLYTDAELLNEVQTYGEYRKKVYFLRNYWIMQYDHVSACYIGKEQKEKVEKERKNFPFYNHVSFCYVADEEIIKTSVKYLKHLQNAYEKLKADDKTFREMIRYELANHEACYTWDYSGALESLGLIYDELTETQKKIVKEELKKQIERYDEE